MAGKPASQKTATDNASDGAPKSILGNALATAALPMVCRNFRLGNWATILCAFCGALPYATKYSNVHDSHKRKAVVSVPQSLTPAWSCRRNRGADLFWVVDR